MSMEIFFEILDMTEEKNNKLIAECMIFPKEMIRCTEILETVKMLRELKNRNDLSQKEKDNCYKKVNIDMIKNMNISDEEKKILIEKQNKLWIILHR